MVILFNLSVLDYGETFITRCSAYFVSISSTLDKMATTSSSSFLSGFLREFHPRSTEGMDVDGMGGGAVRGAGASIDVVRKVPGASAATLFQHNVNPRSSNSLSVARLLRVPGYRGISEGHPLCVVSRYFNHSPFYARKHSDIAAPSRCPSAIVNSTRWLAAQLARLRSLIAFS